MATVRELFFYVSGEHETLPYAEIKAILEADSFSCRNTIFLPRVLCVESNVKCLSSVADRSSFTKACGIVILRCGAYKEVILRTIKEVDYSNFITKRQTFSVDIKTIARPKIDTKLESAIGRVISRKIQGVKVKLKDPDVSFFGIVSHDIFVLGQKIFEPPRAFLKRKMSSRPFTHPSAMTPKLARVIVNLARTKTENLVLDPFCGTGSILVEAGSIGCRILGSDISSEMLKGTKRNLRYFGILWEGLVTSEARHLPFANISHIVTDPPYGRASSTRGISTKKIVSDFLAEALEILPIGGYISIVLPNTLKVGEISKDLGYVNVESHLVREHKSLTRKISVIRKP